MWGWAGLGRTWGVQAKASRKNNTWESMEGAVDVQGQVRSRKEKRHSTETKKTLKNQEDERKWSLWGPSRGRGQEGTGVKGTGRRILAAHLPPIQPPVPTGGRAHLIGKPRNAAIQDQELGLFPQCYEILSGS